MRTTFYLFFFCAWGLAFKVPMPESQSNLESNGETTGPNGLPSAAVDFSITENPNANEPGMGAFTKYVEVLGLEFTLSPVTMRTYCMRPIF